MNALKSLEAHQQKIAEEYLLTLLDIICRKLHIQLDEWEPNKDLYTAIILSNKNKLRSCKHYFDDYDNFFNLIKKLKIKINCNYKWFTSLGDHI
jgi:hypothetical protein